MLDEMKKLLSVFGENVYVDYQLYGFPDEDINITVEIRGFGDHKLVEKYALVLNKLFDEMGYYKSGINRYTVINNPHSRDVLKKMINSNAVKNSIEFVINEYKEILDDL